MTTLTLRGLERQMSRLLAQLERALDTRVDALEAGAVFADIRLDGAETELDQLQLGMGQLSGGAWQVASISNQATTSGTTKDFPIAAGVRRITVSWDRCGLNGSKLHLIQLRTGGVVTTSGYLGSSGSVSGSSASSSAVSAGFGPSTNGDISGSATLIHQGGNTWTCSGSVVISTGGVALGNVMLAGTIALSGQCDGLRITSTSPPDTFDLGSVTVIAERLVRF